MRDIIIVKQIHSKSSFRAHPCLLQKAGVPAQRGDWFTFGVFFFVHMHTFMISLPIVLDHWHDEGCTGLFECRGALPKLSLHGLRWPCWSFNCAEHLQFSLFLSTLEYEYSQVSMQYAGSFFHFFADCLTAWLWIHSFWHIQMPSRRGESWWAPLKSIGKGRSCNLVMTMYVTWAATKRVPDHKVHAYAILKMCLVFWILMEPVYMTSCIPSHRRFVSFVCHLLSTLIFGPAAVASWRSRRVCVPRMASRTHAMAYTAQVRSTCYFMIFFLLCLVNVPSHAIIYRCAHREVHWQPIIRLTLVISVHLCACLDRTDPMDSVRIQSDTEPRYPKVNLRNMPIKDVCAFCLYAVKSTHTVVREIHALGTEVLRWSLTWNSVSFFLYFFKHRFSS